jgi:hypothetical protein
LDFGYHNRNCDLNKNMEEREMTKEQETEMNKLAKDYATLFVTSDKSGIEEAFKAGYRTVINRVEKATARIQAQFFDDASHIPEYFV